MTRTVLAMMAGMLCALAGLRYASSLRREAERLKRWTQVLGSLSLLLQERTLSLPEALYAAADGDSPPDRLLRDMSDKVQQTPLMTMEGAFRAVCGDVPEQDVLCRLFARLGRGSLESRTLALEQGIRELALMQEQSAARADKDAKLWQTLGLIGGICVTIMLI